MTNGRVIYLATVRAIIYPLLLLMLTACSGSGSDGFENLFTSVQLSVTKVDPDYLYSDVAEDIDGDESSTGEPCALTTVSDSVQLTLQSRGLKTIDSRAPSEVRFNRYKVSWYNAEPRNNCEINSGCKRLLSTPQWGVVTLTLPPNETIDVTLPIVSENWKSQEGGLIDSCSIHKNGGTTYCKYYVTIELYGVEVTNDLEKVVSAGLTVEFNNYNTKGVMGKCLPN